MQKKKVAGLVGGVAVLALFLVPTAVSAAPHGSSSSSQDAKAGSVTFGPAPECLGFAASSPQTRVITDDVARTNTSTAWTTLPCGTGTTVSVPRGRSGLVVAHVDAEVSCQGPSGQWCQGRVLIGGVEGEPNAPEPDSFAWATARNDLDQWEANAFTRTRRVLCPTTSITATCSFGVVVQVRNHAAGMIMRVDDRTLHVQTNF